MTPENREKRNALISLKRSLAEAKYISRVEETYLSEFSMLLEERANEGYKQGYNAGRIEWMSKGRQSVKELPWFKRLFNQF